MALSDAFKGMGGPRVIMMIIVSLAMIGFFGALTMKLSTANMAPLYTDLALDDSSKIIGELEKSGTPYEVVGNGSQILVPADKVLKLRMGMAAQGIPSGGNIVGYEIFDRSETFGSSNFVMNVNMTRALEGELARTIASMSDVEAARVHLVMPKRELFTRDKDKPSASITIKMRGSHTLERGEVTAITHIVASSVPGLESSRVTVADNHGRLLARGDGGDGMDAGADSATEARVAYETRMQQTLEELLEKVVGAGKARVTVTADMNFDRIVTNSEKFDPEGAVPRSTQSTSQKETAQDKSGGGDVSAANNLPGGAAGGAGGGSNKSTEQSGETTNYEISKTVQNHISEGGKVNKISVAALVDGVTTADADGKETYAPRSDEEMKQLKNIISTAIGYDEKRGDKIELVNMHFTPVASDLAEGSFFDSFKTEMHSIIQTLILAVVAILAILLVLRPAVTQLIRAGTGPSALVANDLAALENQAVAAGAAPTAPRLPGAPPLAGGAAAQQQPQREAQPEMMIDVANIKGGMKSSSIKKINEIVEKYPEETMGVVRQWVAR
jgi:flagellar M-ring protein FliF